jgi:hemerythrin
MPLAWSEEYALGIPRIDEHHRELFRCIGALHEALMAGQPSGEVTRILDFLADYTQYHFRAEEELMAQHGYAFLPQHRAEHQALVQQVSSWKKGRAEGQLSLTMQITCRVPSACPPSIRTAQARSRYWPRQAEPKASS